MGQSHAEKTMAQSMQQPRTKKMVARSMRQPCIHSEQAQSMRQPHNTHPPPPMSNHHNTTRLQAQSVRQSSKTANLSLPLPARPHWSELSAVRPTKHATATCK
mmetsp:Transcript_15927/g.25773  ORF Transcript_15927/g.25773 Transcript_15927/m.25773 type:complete len:103 (-) Transcript_15927:424-732(-)